MKRLISCLALLSVVLTGCETVDSDSASRVTMSQAIRAEPPGDYFVARRMYKEDYKVWGWVRQPGQPWKTSQLVMLNEQKKLAPDRERNAIGSDNNYEYKFYGYFSGQKVYEPASDGIYPEFVLTGYEIKDTNPPNIYTTKRQAEPSVRILQPPN